jgi:predicted house-cleaning noncanonical NTP pyrophosphatase (MazG superfamily)
MKLVRDKIPEIIRAKGGTPKTKVVSDDNEYWGLLKQKLLEEVKEFLKEENIEELADVLEVVHAICSFKGWDLKDVEKLRIKKREKRGGFEKRIVLIESEGR